MGRILEDNTKRVAIWLRASTEDRLRKLMVERQRDGFNHACYIGRPGPSMEYWLSGPFNNL